MIENETSLRRIDSDTDDMLESYVFDQSEPIERRVLGDTVCLTGKFRGDHVPSLDAYVPRHKIGTETSKRKQIQRHRLFRVCLPPLPANHRSPF